LTTLSVRELAAHDSAVTAVYGDGKDAWAFLDLTGAWPKDKGEGIANLNGLADWLVGQARTRLGA
jgi:CRISPR system Cascade subunit CasC